VHPPDREGRLILVASWCEMSLCTHSLLTSAENRLNYTMHGGEVFAMGGVSLASVRNRQETK